MGFLAGIREHLPFLMTAVPAAGALATWFQSRRSLAAARQTAVATATLALALTIVTAWRFVSAGSNVPLGSAAPWLTAGPIRIAWAFGIDGVSLGPVCVLAVIGWTTVLVADRVVLQWSPKAYAGLLWGQSLGMGLFTAQDFTLFLLFCEGWAWWVFLVIGAPGGRERRAPAQRFLLISSLANKLWGLAGIGLATCLAWIQVDLGGKAPAVSFFYPELIGPLSRSIYGHEIAWLMWVPFQPWILLLWLSGLWLRWPIFPLHGWWPSVLSQARAPIAALCGATTLLQSGYLLFRFVVPLFPPGASEWPMVLSVWAGFGALAAGLLAVSQRDLRSLAGSLSLGALSVALITGLAGTVFTSLICWQLLLMLSLLVAAAQLLTGRMEASYQTTEIENLSGLAYILPRWFAIFAASFGLMTAIPAVTLISGQFIPELLELGRWNWPNLSLLIGGLLGSWAALRALLQIGFGPACDPSPDERHASAIRIPQDVATLPHPADKSFDLEWREMTIGVLVGLALCCGLLSSQWQQYVRPAWEKIHDPFAGVDVPSGSSSASPTPHTSSLDSIRVETLKPVVEENTTGIFKEFGTIASTMWLVCGVIMILIPRFLPKLRNTSTIAIIGLIGGLLADLAWQWQFSGNSTTGQTWHFAVICSLSLTGLAALTLGSEASQSTNWTGLGTWLVRLGAVGWAAMTNQWVACGVAWEVAEFARGSSPWLPSAAGPHAHRERVRHMISSGCFWLGIMAFVSVTGSGLKPLADASPVGNRILLVGLILTISAIGIRSGLAPWSLGRREQKDPFPPLAVQWLDHLLGLVLLLKVVLTAESSAGNSLLVFLSISGGGTALWAGVSLVGEEKIKPFMRNLCMLQFAGLIILTATLAAVAGTERIPGAALIDRSLTIQIWSFWIVIVSLITAGLSAILKRIGAADADVYFENYRGFISKRPLEGCILAGLLFGFTAAFPLSGFWPTWLSWAAAVMTPLRGSAESLLPSGVILAAVACFAIGQLIQLTILARWLGHLYFDPPVSLPDGSGRRWDLAMGLAAVLLCFLLGIQPALLWNFWLTFAS